MKKVIQKLNKRIFNSKKVKINDTILITGSPRSGTTWLMQILCEIPDYTYIFEPLNPIWFPSAYKIGFRSRTYLNDNTKWPKGEEYLKNIFTGRLANLPIKNNPISDLIYDFSFNNFFNHLYATKLIVKSVNMNRMLPWVAKTFELRSILFIVRHPYATIASQLKSGLYGYHSISSPYINIYPTKKIILKEIKDIVELSSNQINKIKKLEKIEELLAVSWCLDNLIPFSKNKPYSWKLISYENLINDPENEICNIFKFINEKEVPRSAFHRLRKPSIVTMKDERRLIKTPEKQLSKWKVYLSKKQINRIKKVIAYFNFYLYDENGKPNY
jgi:hypothetical protein